MRKLVVICLVFFSLSALSQTVKDPYAAKWKIVDSLISGGLPESAKKIALDVYDDAKKSNRQAEQLKAQIYLLHITRQNSENGDSITIAKAEQEAARSSFPYKAVWQSIIADLYWNYYSMNRWKILQRTKTGVSPSADFAFWDANQFYDKVRSLYLASIARAAELQKIPVAQLDPIVIKGVNTEQLRPTVYDLLAFRAVSYFENDEKEITKASYSFTITGGKYFTDAASFAKLKLSSKDSGSLHFKALQTYQDIIAFHLKDEQADALIDADLQRLEFVYQYSLAQNKKLLYEQALKKIVAAYPHNPQTSVAQYRLLELDDDNDYYNVSKETKTDVPALKKGMERIIADYPNTEGAAYAASKLQAINSKVFHTTLEEVMLPEEPNKFLASYRNVSKVYFRVVAVDENIENENFQDDSALKSILLVKTPLNSWTETLPGTEDLRMHTTEIKLAPLPVGRYVLISSTEVLFPADSNIITSAFFRVSSLSFVTKERKNDLVVGYVMNRKTGAPIAGVQVSFYNQSYDNVQRGYFYKMLHHTVSGANGSFSAPDKKENASRIEIIKDNDRLVAQSYIDLRKEDVQTTGDKTDTVSLFFTDRAIYRPGQTVYYKGILFAVSKDGKRKTVVSGYKDEIEFKNANNTTIDSARTTSNDFGSFKGSFVIPTSGMNGDFEIMDEFGEVSIKVEEYKRPKFDVQFDTLKNSYALNENITVTGKANAYSGAVIGGASVQYSVTRQAIFSYPMFYRYPNYRGVQQIAQGTVQTKNDGSFSISFKATPDSSIDPKTLPKFQYRVTVDVTDLNGETHSATNSYSAGYHALDLFLNVPAGEGPAQVNKIYVSTQNLNGYFKETKVKLKISLLRSPERFYRKRAWETPDQFVINEQEFRGLFPLDEYKNENDHEQWAVKETVLDTTITTVKSKEVNIPAGTWKENGWYTIEVSATDGKGHELKQKEYKKLFSSSLPGLDLEPLALSFRDSQTVLGVRSFFTDVPVLVKEVGKQSFTQVITTKGNKANYKLQSVQPGVTVSAIIIKDNRAYTADITQEAAKHASNKELNIHWATHRDKLQPGAKETWTMTVSGTNKDKLGAEMAAALYDASLDAFVEHSWDNILTGLDEDETYQNEYVGGWLYGGNFRGIMSRQIGFYPERALPGYDKVYADLPNVRYLPSWIRMLPTRNTGDIASTTIGVYQPKSGDYRMEGARAKGSLYIIDGFQANGESEKSLSEVAVRAIPAKYGDASGGVVDLSKQPVQIRKNLNETAFFYPQLRTDAEGNIKIEFTMPEALTEWKLMGFAHTKDMKYGVLEGRVKTQKDLMVVPGLPRFFRQGDDMVITTKINNLSDKELSGKAELQILDAQTLKPLNIPFRIKESVTSFKVVAGQSTTASWNIHIPESLYEPVVVRITAGAGDFTDGEENTLPVITNRMLVTETLPLWMNGSGTKTFSLDKLKYSDSSKTLAQHKLTVEYTSNPAWYAVQALPYLMEYPYECAEQTFNRYYANALAAQILDQSPKVKAIFNKWENEDTAALLSNLEKNQELKSALLEETPWVMEAKSEKEQKHRVAMLFATNKLKNEQDATLKKLEDMQMSGGGFSWFKGGNYADRYITQYIATGLERLHHLGVTNKQAGTIAAKARAYLDREIKNEYQELLKEKNVKLEEQHIGYMEIEQLYLHSFAKTTDTAVTKAYEYYRKQAVKYWPAFNAYMKGMIAITLNRAGDKQTAGTIIQSLKETAIHNEEQGMYWKQSNSWWWYEAPIETQSLLIECFNEVARDTTSVNAMKRWLLIQKQTTNWATTKATADACYALLLNGSKWVNEEPEVTIKLGDETVSSKTQKQEAGTGYFKTSFPGAQVKADMGNVTVTSSGSSSAQWGAVYWQYFENLDKISPAATGVVVRKQLFISRNSDNGPVLTPITEKNAMKIGDKVTVRIEITADRDMEYVHLKDVRGACFEPVNVLSGYKYQDGLGYYESTKDLSSNFFISYLRKGKYVFEYPVFVTNSGDFSAGIATLQCMYAPQFSSHSEGVRVNVKP